MVSQTGKWMDIIDKSGLPGKYKAWCYQHGILQKITWPLLMNEVPLTKVESLERMFNRHLCKWLGAPKSFCNRTSSNLQLQLSTITEDKKSLETGRGNIWFGYGEREKSSGRASWFLVEPDQLSRCTPGDCRGQRRNSRGEGIHLMMEPAEQWKHCN
ncbi:unnamed protein product [Mytilus edulis]|uniref:Uncharacterized protein n=1 Tax=Mytilus edulis TaxID=6550 RepID=A0A8S3UTH6_MYTED|nr:unnamed protein product [Mytilus edulis]